MLLVNTWSIILATLALLGLMMGLFMMSFRPSTIERRMFGLCLVLASAVIASESFIIASNRAQDQLAKKEFTAAGYNFTTVNRFHAKIRIVDCTAPFRVIMVHGIYRPAWPLKPNYIGGPIHWRAISPAGMKHAYCSA